ncbi:MAG: GH116 family glycosyl hydrolase [Deltaproteobacteria bacterium]
MKSGVPLGGLGAGKLEILPNGLLDNFTFLSGPHAPVTSAGADGQPKGIPGFHCALWVLDKKKASARWLQTVPLGDAPTVGRITYAGSFPFAELSYEDASSPVSCVLEAYAPFIPGDEKNSGLPAAIFRFRLTNPWARPVDAALMMTGRNMVGSWGVGRFNQVAETNHALHLSFFNKKTSVQDPLAGEMCLSLLRRPGQEATYLGEWNMQGRPFVFDAKTFNGREAWEPFHAQGRLPNTNGEQLVAAESVELGGALAARVHMKARSSASVTFLLTWFSSAPGEGRMYQNQFRGAREAAAYAFAHEKVLHEKTRAFAKGISSLKIGDWLKDALTNNLYPFSSSSLWTKRGRFGFFEAPQVCPLFDTLDVRFYASAPLCMLFPGLEARGMLQFAEAQRPQGYVPHDLGFRRTDLASNSTNGLLWKDLNAKFILLAYRNYLWTKDEAALRKLYPFVKKAFYWLAATDKNKDGLPDNEGADQTFDLWELYGTAAYTSGIFLAALLALEKMAGLVGEESVVKEVRQWSKKGRASFEKKLWNKSYYMAYNSVQEGLTEKQLAHHAKTQKVSLSCAASQLVGQWIAHALGLGYIVAPEKVKKALQTILKLNAEASAFGVVNAVAPSGEKDKANRQTENCWFGVAYVVAGLAIYEGLEKEGLEVAEKAWRAASVHALNPWNQPDMCAAADGAYLFGDHYMRNMVVWSLVSALAGGHKDCAAFLESLR